MEDFACFVVDLVACNEHLSRELAPLNDGSNMLAPLSIPVCFVVRVVIDHISYLRWYLYKAFGYFAVAKGRHCVWHRCKTRRRLHSEHEEKGLVGGQGKWLDV